MFLVESLVGIIISWNCSFELISNVENKTDQSSKIFFSLFHMKLYTDPSPGMATVLAEERI